MSVAGESKEIEYSAAETGKLQATIEIVPEINLPTADKAGELEAKESVAARAMARKRNPIRASNTTGSNSHWVMVNATVCKPRW